MKPDKENIYTSILRDITYSYKGREMGGFRKIRIFFYSFAADLEFTILRGVSWFYRQIIGI
jgi:hypothetical protein